MHMPNTPDKLTLRQALRRIRDARLLHGSYRHRAVWALALYHYGRWVLAMRAHPFRWIGNKLYGLAMTFAPVLTGVSLDRHTRLGEKLHIIHPGMVLIHADVQIGDRCGLMHGVTLGTSPSNPGVPTLGNDVFIGAGATILGGLRIGDGAKIAANSLVICDVPAGATAIGVPAKVYPASRVSASPLAPAQSNAPGAERQAAGEAVQPQVVKMPPVPIV
jgi:serine O-acetyltransferase